MSDCEHFCALLCTTGLVPAASPGGQPSWARDMGTSPGWARDMHETVSLRHGSIMLAHIKLCITQQVMQLVPTTMECAEW
jgi:hypothetical protein